MRVCQIRFQTLFAPEGKEGPDRTYDKTGKYNGEAAKGAVASQAWRQFK